MGGHQQASSQVLRRLFGEWFLSANDIVRAVFSYIITMNADPIAINNSVCSIVSIRLHYRKTGFYGIYSDRY